MRIFTTFLGTFSSVGWYCNCFCATAKLSAVIQYYLAKGSKYFKSYSKVGRMKILSSFEFWSAENFWNNFSRSRIGQKKDQQIDYSCEIKGALILNIENKWMDELVLENNWKLSRFGFWKEGIHICHRLKVLNSASKSYYTIRQIASSG